MPDQSSEDREGATKIACRSLAQGIFRTAAIWIRSDSLSSIALVEGFGLVHFRDEVQPVRNELIIGSQELDIGDCCLEIRTNIMI